MTKTINSSLLILSLLLLFTICGCNTKTNKLDQSNNNMVFIGESKHWLATYTINFFEDNTFKRLLDIKPKESNSVNGLIEYSLFKNGEKETYGTGEAGNKIGGTGGGSGAKPQKSDKYVLVTKWEDGEETFPLDLK